MATFASLDTELQLKIIQVALESQCQPQVNVGHCCVERDENRRFEQTLLIRQLKLRNGTCPDAHKNPPIEQLKSPFEKAFYAVTLKLGVERLPGHVLARIAFYAAVHPRHSYPMLADCAELNPIDWRYYHTDLYGTHFGCQLALDKGGSDEIQIPPRPQPRRTGPNYGRLQMTSKLCIASYNLFCTSRMMTALVLEALHRLFPVLERSREEAEKLARRQYVQTWWPGYNPRELEFGLAGIPYRNAVMQCGIAKVMCLRLAMTRDILTGEGPLINGRPESYKSFKARHEKKLPGPFSYGP